MSQLYEVDKWGLACQAKGAPAGSRETSPPSYLCMDAGVALLHAGPGLLRDRTRQQRQVLVSHERAAACA